ncbi:sensor histidine kinase [Microbacterium rhizomatis]|uniref:histidine kinase n=1 Tax=Microbacterium rhizomatis TaxID=1631477 RepID=A0A5J5J6Y7_9MICO|nr:sensor histidine kinase [Microbacterium rhizomatis]KAA9110894.1 sensor histidine kinase [Microbacterium rhizomatis]
MPGAEWNRSALEAAPRFPPPPAVTLLVPVAIAFIVQVPATIAISVWQHVGPLPAFANTLLAATSALALLAARRWPGPTVAVVAALATIDLFVPPDAGPPSIALAFAIIGGVVRGARTWALVAVGTAWVTAVVTAGVVGQSWHPFRIALVTVGLAACFAIGEGIRSRFEHAAARRAQLSERRLVAEQEERTRIARELHDVLAHSLSQIAVQSGVGLHLFDREPERAREALASIRSLSATGLDEVRGVLTFLRGDEGGAPRTAPLTPQPQLADLAPLVAQRSSMGLTVTLEDRLGGAMPSSAVQTTAYRIAQEALTNVVRHSAAVTATVTLARVGSDLVVTIEDDGTGVEEARSEGAGIRGMRERAALADGSLAITPTARGGTTVTARLPWDGPQ